MKTMRYGLLPAVIGLLASGCLAEVGERELNENVGEAASELENANALNVNALNLNALNPNALNLNALNLNALSPTTMSSSAMTALQDPSSIGDLSRQLLKYTVSCAFTTAQPFQLSWTDSESVVHDETYWGLLGLAPGWRIGLLSASGREWVSACLASRVNWYTTPVMLSSRGPNAALAPSDSSELSTFTMNEGAFWGDLFATPPQVYACNYAPNIEHSRLNLRDCAAGHVGPTGDIEECGVLDIVGTCEEACEQLNTLEGYYPSCRSDPQGADVTSVVTVFLQ